MKSFKFLSLIALLIVGFACTSPQKKDRSVDPTKAVVFYTGDDATQIAGAALVGIKYYNTTFVDVDSLSATLTTAAVTAMDSVHRAFILCDTAIAWAANKITGANFRAIQAKLIKTPTTGVILNTTNRIFVATATQTKCEAIWDTLYPGITEPLVFQYLGYAEFSAKHNQGKHTNTTLTLVDTTGSMSTNAYQGMTIYLESGNGIGESRVIASNNATTFTISPRWKKVPDKPLYVIKKSGETGEGFYDVYTKYYVLSALKDLSSSAVIANWHKLIDMNYNINDGNVKNTPYQDIDYLMNTVIPDGKLIFDYLVNLQY